MQPLRVTARFIATHKLLCVALTLALWSFVACIHIEILNARAESWLPHTGGGKWRSGSPELLWRDMNKIPFERPLNAIEEQTMRNDQWFIHMVAMSRLHDAVETYGLPQYLAVPLLLLFGFIGLGVENGKIKWLFIVPLVVAAIAGFRLLALNYIGSLGW